MTGNHYRLVSQPFAVVKATTLSVEVTSARLVQVRYPDAVVEKDITYRPRVADGSLILWQVVGETVPAGAALDTYGNCNGASWDLEPGTRGGADPSADPSICRVVDRSRPVPPAATGHLPTTGAPPLAGLAAILALLGLVTFRHRSSSCGAGSRA